MSEHPIRGRRRRAAESAPSAALLPAAELQSPSLAASPSWSVPALHDMVGNALIHAALATPEPEGHLGHVRGALTASLAEAPSVVQRLSGNSGAQAALQRSRDPGRMPSGSGRPLPAALQQRVDQAFGRDLSQVRLHDDPAAQAKAREIDAVAFTAGTDIYAGPGVDLEDEGHQDVLLHELVHVEQHLQNRLAGKRGVAPDSDPHEVEARQRTGPLLRAMGEEATPEGEAPARPPSPEASLDELARQLDAPLPEQIRERMAERLAARLPGPDPAVEAGLAGPTLDSATPWLEAAPPARAPLLPVAPSAPAPGAVSSVEEAFEVVERSFAAALDAEAQTRQQRRAANVAASPVAPIASDAMGLAGAQAQAEQASLQGRASQDAQGLGEAGQGGGPVAAPAGPSARPQTPETPTQPALQRMSTPDSGGGPVSPPPAQEEAAGGGEGPEPASVTAPAEDTGGDAAPATQPGAEGLSPEAPPVAAPSTSAPHVEADPVVEAAEAVVDAEVEVELAERQLELSQRELDELEAQQHEAEARAQASGNPDDVQGGPNPSTMASVQDEVARDQLELQEAQGELEAAQRQQQSAQQAAQGGGGGGGGAPPDMAAEAAASAEQAAAEAAAQVDADAAGDSAALEQEADAALTTLLAELQALAQDLLAQAESLAEGVVAAGEEAAQAARDRARAEADRLLADARAEADAARSSASSDQDEEGAGDAQAQADAEADRILAEAEAEADRVIQEGEDEAQALIEAANEEAEALRTQGQEAAAQAEATGEAGAEAMRSQLLLAQDQLQLDAQASITGLEAERDAAVAATQEILTQVPEPPETRDVVLIEDDDVGPEYTPNYDTSPAVVAEGEVLEATVYDPGAGGAVREDSPLLMHLEGMISGALDADFEAALASGDPSSYAGPSALDALGVDRALLDTLGANQHLYNTWEGLLAADVFTPEQVAQLQAVAAQDMVAQLDPDAPANLMLSWYDSHISTVKDYEATQPHLDNTLHLDNADMGELAAIMNAADFQRLVLSTHGLPGGILTRDGDAPTHSTYDAATLAQLAEGAGVEQVLLAHCYGGLGEDGLYTMDTLTREANGSSAAAFAAMGMDVMAFEGAVKSSTATDAVGLWSELIAAGVPDDVALQMAGSFANATGGEALDNIDWQRYDAHVRAELGADGAVAEWANTHGFVETQINGERIGPEQMLPLMAEYGPALLSTSVVQDFLGDAENPMAVSAELFARMVVNDLVQGGGDPLFLTDVGQDANTLTRLFEATWSGDPLVDAGQVPSWADMGPRLFQALEGQAAAIFALPPEHRAELQPQLQNLQAMRDALWIHMAMNGEGVPMESGQLALLPTDDVAAMGVTEDPLATSEGLPVADLLDAPAVDPAAPVQPSLLGETLGSANEPTPAHVGLFYQDLLTGDADTIRAAVDGALAMDPDALSELGVWMPDMIASLPDEARATVGLYLWERGSAVDAAQRDGLTLDPELVERENILGQSWAEATAVHGQNPFGGEIQSTLAVAGEDWDRHAAEIQAIFGVSFDGEWSDNQAAWGHFLAQNPELWTDMGMPSTMWTYAGDIARYSGTMVMGFAGEEGIRVFRNDRPEDGSVTQQEMGVAESLTFYGPGALPDAGSALFRAETLDQLTALGFDQLHVEEREGGGYLLVPYGFDADGVTIVREGALTVLDADGNVVEAPEVSFDEAAALIENAGGRLEAVEEQAAAEGPPSSGWQGGAHFEDGGLSYEASDGSSSVNASINGGVELSGLTPLTSFAGNTISGGGRINLSGGQLEVGLQGGLTRNIRGQDLQAIGYGGLTFGQGGELTGFHAGGSVEYGGVQASLAFSYEDRDFATYVPASDGNPGMVFYGNSTGYSVGGGGAVPVGPFVVGADGSIQRSTTVQAFTTVSNLPGLDPTLAQTDPKAYRDAVAAEMAGMTEGIESAEDLSVDAILGWDPGSGLMIERMTGGGAGGTFGTLAVSVTGGVEEQRVEQLSVQRNADGTVSVTVTSQDTDSFNAGLNVGPAGLTGTQSDTTSSAVTFNVDPSTPEGRAALETFLQTGSLPGAMDYAADMGVIPQNVDLSDPGQVEQYVVAANRAFLLAQGDQDTRWGPEQSGATYTGVEFSEAMVRSTSIAVLGFDVLSSMTREEWRERMYTVGGEWETNFLYDQIETWMFSRDSHLSGISVNPEVGAYLGMFQQQDASLGWIQENGLGDLVDAGADPFTALYVQGVFDSVDFNNSAQRATLALGLAEADLISIRDELNAMGEINERLAAVDESIDSRLLGFLSDNLHAGLEFTPPDYEVTVTDPGELFRLDELGTYMGVGGDEAIALFGDNADDPLFVTQTLQNVINADPADFESLTPLEQEVYLRVGLASYTEQSQWMANTEGDPYDMLSLVLNVEDPETRDAMLRRTFYAVEQAEDGAQGTLAFLEWSQQLSPDLQARVREGATLQVTGDYLPAQLMLDGLISGGGDAGGGEMAVQTLEGLSVEQRTLFFDALPQLMQSEQFLAEYAAAHGEPFPYESDGPVAWMFAAMDNPYTQAQLLTYAQGTPYEAELLQFAEAHPEAFLGGEFHGDPAYLDAAVSTLVAAGVDPTAMGLSADEALGHLRWDPIAQADYIRAVANTGDWPALQDALLDDPTLLFAEVEHMGEGGVFELLDALREAGAPDAVIADLLARTARFDDSDYADSQEWVADGRPDRVGERLRDVQDDIDWPGGHSRGEWMTGLLMGVADDPAASQAAVDAYIVADGGDPASAVDHLLGTLDGDPAQLALAAQVLEQAGYGDQVARWRGERGW
ncbi:MAG: DUF4157 domain-containing protein [Alphaproteobacteria bacterium]|nr:DUF4157 domain-containing protein [Alphaproteobacteria bacterium]MCB9792108.1 DUF4157 domain-containing protein [Alphaproteobacteria bacterium]